ncbi:ATP-binding cassette domain-containing protein [Vagococcus sp. PNs007]|uniref:ATP-binding cassette domain-containing protein n=1 Tax=Vagococcus proximus TaxID=2991417 RepID=A0ABT5X2X9_9ENTE|nr:ATP-binding cassette domain-containing protein [Vagococcus proximus]MDF0480354.1 ATP-binding cassette domain-containing protein [Vagococcus proximus]
MAQLEMRNLTKKVGFSYYFINTNLKIPEKKILGLLGKNNVGKTYLCYMLAGLDTEYEGQIIWDSATPVGLVDGKEELNSSETIQCYFESIIELDKKGNTRDWIQVLEEVGLDRKSLTPLCDYSCMNKKKVMIAKTILFNRELVIFDEPFYGLDTFSKIEIKALIIKMMQNHYTMVVTSPHEKDLTEICDIIYLIEGRQIHRFV